MSIHNRDREIDRDMLMARQKRPMQEQVSTDAFQQAVSNMRTGDPIQDNLNEMQNPLTQTQDPTYAAQAGSDCGSRGCSTSIGGGGAQKPKVLCTAIAELGHISPAVLAADYRQAETFSDTTARGYRAWATPVANFLLRHENLAKVVAPFCKAWANNMAYKDGTLSKISFFDRYTGTILEMVGAPICFIIGCFTNAE